MVLSNLDPKTFDFENYLFQCNFWISSFRFFCKYILEFPTLYVVFENISYFFNIKKKKKKIWAVLEKLSEKWPKNSDFLFLYILEKIKIKNFPNIQNPSIWFPTLLSIQNDPKIENWKLKIECAKSKQKRLYRFSNFQETD